jgi:acrylyl-CoA reductase (NADPH)
MSTFRAYRVTSDNGTTAGRVVDTTLDELSAGDVVIAAEYSSVNFKDMRVATGTFRAPIRFPRIPGIDVAGVVSESRDARFRAGDRVLVTGYDLGVGHDGGYAGYVRVPGDWVVPVPEPFTTFEAMALGTAGFTAALAIIELERNGLHRSNGHVVVTGATGGVGSIGIDCLHRLAYRVTAVTRKAGEGDYLRRLGAADVISPAELNGGDGPVGPPTWAGALDPVGGTVLETLTKTMKYGGAIANCGLTGGTELNLTVLPFILRGVKLLGIDSVQCPMATRREVWRRLATDMKPAHLGAIAREITLDQLDETFAALEKGTFRGRAVVRLGA